MYSRFVKIKYEKLFDVKSFANTKQINELDFESYYFGIFVLSENAELLDLVILQKKIKFLIIATAMSVYSEIIKNKVDMPFLDLTKNKHEIFQNLNTIISMLVPKQND